MPQIHTNHVTLEYDIAGSGEPLLLITGLGGQLIDWDEGFVELLVHEGFQVIRFDNRDSGLSSRHQGRIRPLALLRSFVTRRRPPAPYLIDDMATDAAELLAGLGVQSAHVVGASLGGMIAQALAIQHPDKVRSLTSIMSHTGDRRHGRISTRLLLRLPWLTRVNERNAVDKGVQMVAALSGPSFDPVATREKVARAVARSFDPQSSERQSLALFASADRTPKLRSLRVPTLVIHGRRDPLVLPSGGRATARAIPGARLIEFDDMGHELPRHRWAEIIRAISSNAAASLSRLPQPA